MSCCIGPDPGGGAGAGATTLRATRATRSASAGPAVSVDPPLTRGFVFALSAAYSSPRRPAGSDGHRWVAGPGAAPTTRHRHRDLGRGGECRAGREGSESV